MSYEYNPKAFREGLKAVSERTIYFGSVKVGPVSGFHPSYCQLGWQRCFDQAKAFRSRDNNYLLQVSGSVSCSKLLHCSSPLHGHVVQPRGCPASRCRTCFIAHRNYLPDLDWCACRCDNHHGCLRCGLSRLLRSNAGVHGCRSREAYLRRSPSPVECQ